MGYTVTQNHSEYDRGVAAGEIAARLANHDMHFATINGSLGRIADEMNKMRMEIQRQGDRAEADRATVKTTALALREQLDTRQEEAESRWAPLTRLSLVAGIVLAAVGLAAFILSRVH